MNANSKKRLDNAIDMIVGAREEIESVKNAQTKMAVIRSLEYVLSQLEKVELDITDVKEYD